MNVNTLKALITEKQDDVFTAIASSEAEDRQGEVVQVGGWQLKNFKDNPILLFMHDHTKPIGKATRVWTDKASKKLMFKGMMSTATEWGRAAKQLMDEGILKAFSVGFRPLEIDGNLITKAELYEISLVSVPANPEARLLMAKSLEKSGFDEKFIKSFTKEVEKEKTQEAIEKIQSQLSKVTEELSVVKETAQIAVKGLEHLNPLRSKHEVTTQRLALSKVIAKASDKLIGEQMPHDKAVSYAKVIKRSSEMLIRSHKGDL